MMEDLVKDRAITRAMSGKNAKGVTRVHKQGRVHKDGRVQKFVHYGTGRDNRGVLRAANHVDDAEQTIDQYVDAEKNGDDVGYLGAEEDGDDDGYLDAEKDAEGSDDTMELGSGQPRRKSTVGLKQPYRNSAGKVVQSSFHEFKVDPALLPPVKPHYLIAPGQPQFSAPIGRLALPHLQAPTQLPALPHLSISPQIPAPAHLAASAQPLTPPQILAPQAPMTVEHAPTAAPSTPPVADTAASMKRQYSQVMGKGANGKRLTGDRDPENVEIMRLRQECDMEFDAIARQLNEERVKKGMVADMSANAVYSRYKRNGPLIAAARGEEFKATTKDDRYAKIRFARVKPIVGFNEREDALLVQAHKEVQGGFWNYVSARIVQLGGKTHAPESCARRFEYV